MENKKTKSTIAGNNIKTIMIEIGMIQQELSDITGIGTTHLSRIVNGKRKCISLPIAFKIAEALKRPVESVFIKNSETSNLRKYFAQVECKFVKDIKR